MKSKMLCRPGFVPVLKDADKKGAEKKDAGKADGAKKDAVKADGAKK